MLDEATIVAALRRCREQPASVAGSGECWFSARCVLDRLADTVEMDSRRFGELREPLGSWVERHGRFADEPGVRAELEGPLPTVRYIVLAESEWERLGAAHPE